MTRGGEWLNEVRTYIVTLPTGFFSGGGGGGGGGKVRTIHSFSCFPLGDGKGENRNHSLKETAAVETISGGNVI